MSDAPTGYPKEIAKAIIAVKKQIKPLGSDERNEHGKYGYVSVDKFYERIGKLMADAGLALLIDETESDIREGKSGNPWLFARYNLAFLHESGVVSEWLRRSLALPINGPQTYGAAQSYIEKQYLRQIFKVPTGEQDADEMAQVDTPRTAPRAGIFRAPDVPRETQRAPTESVEERIARATKIKDAIKKALQLAKNQQARDDILVLNNTDLEWLSDNFRKTYDQLMEFAAGLETQRAAE